MTIGERIRNLRKKKSITQEQLADRLGLKRSIISKYENGIVDINLSTIKKIADILEISTTDLIEGGQFVDENFDINEDIKKHPEKYTMIKDNTGRTIAHSLNKDHEVMLLRYKALNKKGKEEANNYIAYLSTKDEYTKPDEEG